MISHSEPPTPSFRRGPDGIHRLDTGEEGLVIFTAGKRANPVAYPADFLQARRREKEFIASLTDMEPNRVVLLDQVHGDTIHHIAAPHEPDAPYPKGDGMMTASPRLCLVIRTADCVPLFVFDPRTRALGAAHAGWRGARLGIAAKLIREMKRAFGSRPDEMRAYILPSIGPESYRVGTDVADFFPADTRERGGECYLDLWANIERQIFDEGLPHVNVHNVRLCTLVHQDEFYSYRGKDAGRNLNVGFLES